MEKRTIVQAAIAVLENASQPLTISEIHGEIVRNNLYTFNTPTPEQVLRIQIVRHCEGATWSNMAKKRFFKKVDDSRYTLLAEKEEEATSSDIALPDATSYIDEIRQLQQLHLQQVKGHILEDLKRLSPYNFERFSAQLLSNYGFKDVNVTNVSNDGGIDAYGKLKVGLSYMNVAAQCKRYTGRNKVSRPEIDQFRGAIQGRYEQGIFLTTSQFTDGAKGASFQTGAVPIILIDGPQMAQIMIDHQIGVQRQEVPIFSYDMEMAMSMYD